MSRAYEKVSGLLLVVIFVFDKTVGIGILHGKVEKTLDLVREIVLFGKGQRKRNTELTADARVISYFCGNGFDPSSVGVIPFLRSDLDPCDLVPWKHTAVRNDTVACDNSVTHNVFFFEFSVFTAKKLIFRFGKRAESDQGIDIVYEFIRNEQKDKYISRNTADNN